MTTQHGEAVKQHEAVKVEEAAVAKAEEKEAGAEPVTAAEKARAKAIAAEEKQKKEAEERAAKEPVRSKILRLIGDLRGGQLNGVEAKAAWKDLEELARRLKGEETVGDLEKERKAKEGKEGKG
jgi:hypothetical protein